MNNFWENSLPAGYYDKILTKGLKKNKGIQANWHNATFLAVRSYIHEDDKHLDFACGPGTFIGNYRLNNSHGVDLAATQIKFANSKYGKQGTFQVSDISNLKNEKYDVITVIGLLEFINDKEILDTLTTLYELLNDNGKLVLTTPNYTFSMLVLEKLLNLIGPISYKNQHINRFSKTSLKDLLLETSFKSIEIKKIVNITIFLSFINFNFAKVANSIFTKLFPNVFGFILLAELDK